MLNETERYRDTTDGLKEDVRKSLINNHVVTQRFINDNLFLGNYKLTIQQVVGRQNTTI